MAKKIYIFCLGSGHVMGKAAQKHVKRKQKRYVFLYIYGWRRDRRGQGSEVESICYNKYVAQDDLMMSGGDVVASTSDPNNH